MSPTVIILLLCLAAIYAVAAYALRPPALVAWPDIRAPGIDVAQVRISVQAGRAERAERALQDEKEKARRLQRRTETLSANIDTLRRERDDARTQAYAAVRLAEDDAMVIVRGIVAREMAQSDEGAETVAARVLRLG